MSFPSGRHLVLFGTLQLLVIWALAFVIASQVGAERDPHRSGAVAAPTPHDPLAHACEADCPRLAADRDLGLP